jgi:hypothetical protein
VAALEAARAGVETPEQAEARRRREDGETRLEVERYVARLEDEANARGVCVHCGQRLPTGGANQGSTT